MGAGEGPGQGRYAGDLFLQCQRSDGSARTRATGGDPVRRAHAGHGRIRADGEDQGKLSRAAGDHHDRAFGSRQRGIRVSQWRLRVPAQAVRYRRGGRAGATSLQAASRGPGQCRARERGGDRDHRCRAGDAGGIPRHRAPCAFQHHRTDQWRVGYRQGAGGRCPAQAQPACKGTLCRPEHGGNPARPLGIRTLRPREGCLHRRSGTPHGTLRAGRRRYPVPRRNRRHAGRTADPFVTGPCRR